MPPTALFCIDIQNDLAKDPCTKIPRSQRIISAGSQILSAARHIISVAKSTGSEPPLALYFIQHEEDASSGPLVRGSEPWKLVFEPLPGSDERLIAKRTRDTFASNPTLASSLKEDGVKRLILFGIQSECCVLSTCEGAVAAGFEVVLLSGAHSTYDSGEKTAEEIEKDVEERILAIGGKVVRWQDWVHDWTKGKGTGGA
jgi:nicotinamidase-related amidase